MTPTRCIGVLVLYYYMDFLQNCRKKHGDRVNSTYVNFSSWRPIGDQIYAQFCAYFHSINIVKEACRECHPIRILQGTDLSRILQHSHSGTTDIICTGNISHNLSTMHSYLPHHKRSHTRLVIFPERTRLTHFYCHSRMKQSPPCCPHPFSLFDDNWFLAWPWSSLLITHRRVISTATIYSFCASNRLWFETLICNFCARPHSCVSGDRLTREQVKNKITYLRNLGAG
jgi:hypothetical protein